MLSSEWRRSWLFAKQKSQRFRKALRPLALVVSCSLVDPHPQAAIVEACAAQGPLEFADVFHYLSVFIFAACFSRSDSQKNLSWPLTKKAAVLQYSSMGNKQRRTFHQQTTEHQGPLDDRV